jgi:hypothetical protein
VEKLSARQTNEDLKGEFHRAVGKAAIFLTRKRGRDTVRRAKEAAKQAARVLSGKPPKFTTKAVGALKSAGVYMAKKSALPVAVAGAGVGAYYLKTKIRRKARRLDVEDRLAAMEKKYALDYKQAKRMARLTKEDVPSFSDMVEERLSGFEASEIIERKFGRYFAKKVVQGAAKAFGTTVGKTAGVAAVGLGAYAGKKAIGHHFRKKGQEREYKHAQRMKALKGQET